MKLLDLNGSSSLIIDEFVKVGNRIEFNVTAFLLDDRTDTNIWYETRSFVNIDDWEKKRDTLLSEYKLELEDLSFHVDFDQMYYWDRKKISNQNLFTLSSAIGNSRLSCMIESDDVFGRTFIEEVSDAIQYQPSISIPNCVDEKKDGLVTKITLKYPNITDATDDTRCEAQIEAQSSIFCMKRRFDEFYVSLRYYSDAIRQFNAYKLERFDMLTEGLKVDFVNENSRKRGVGDLNDFTWPSNKLEFEGPVEVESETIDS